MTTPFRTQTLNNLIARNKVVQPITIAFHPTTREVGVFIIDGDTIRDVTDTEAGQNVVETFLDVLADDMCNPECSHTLEELQEIAGDALQCPVVVNTMKIG